MPLGVSRRVKEKRELFPVLEESEEWHGGVESGRDFVVDKQKGCDY